MNTNLIVLACALLATGIVGCGSIEQQQRDSLRYAAMNRGTEVYELNPDWVFDSDKRGSNLPVSPIAASKIMSSEHISFYERYLAAQSNEPITVQFMLDLVAKMKAEAASSAAVLSSITNHGKATAKEKTLAGSLLNQIAAHKVQIEAIEKLLNEAKRPELPLGVDLKPLRTTLSQLGEKIEDIKTATNKLCTANMSVCTAEQYKLLANPVDEDNKPGTSGTTSQILSKSQSEKFWPQSVLEKSVQDEVVTDYADGKPTKTVTKKGLGEELIRALSSTTSVAQMRDLLTEPTFPSLPPINREVTLGCLPPPDQAAYTATSSITANLAQILSTGENNKPKSDASINAAMNYASHVQKMFEESERTLFLQYALYRLCEMSVNAPSEFRNVYPVIVHDIVRRTAELREIETAAVQKKLAEDAKVKSEEAKSRAAEEMRKAEEAKIAQEKEKQNTEKERIKTAEKEREVEVARKAVEDTKNTVSADALKSQQSLLEKKVDLLVVSCMDATLTAETRGKKEEVDKVRESCEKTYSPDRKLSAATGAK